jgi:acetyl-CoA carboxylase biotin carboxyl carrier protein
VGLSDDDVREILRIIDESDLDELTLETEGFSLHVRKGASAEGATSEASGENETDSQSHAPAPGLAPAPAPAPGSAPGPAPGSPAPTGAHPADENETDSQSQDGLVDIESPMLGTFYRAESPGAAPFVELGATVEPDTIVCIIEVMKMMNSISAGVSGTVAEVCPANGGLVEYGEPLFRVRPQ